MIELQRAGLRDGVQESGSGVQFKSSEVLGVQRCRGRGVQRGKPRDLRASTSEVWDRELDEFRAERAGGALGLAPPLGHQLDCLDNVPSPYVTSCSLYIYI